MVLIVESSYTEHGDISGKLKVNGKALEPIFLTSLSWIAVRESVLSRLDGQT